MPKLLPITLSSLEDGLRPLQNCAQPCIDELKAKLATGISITDEEEAWFDGDANFTDEMLVLSKLQQKKDFQSAFNSLSDSEKAIVECIQAEHNINQNLKHEHVQYLND